MIDLYGVESVIEEAVSEGRFDGARRLLAEYADRLQGSMKERLLNYINTEADSPEGRRRAIAFASRHSSLATAGSTA